MRIIFYEKAVTGVSVDAVAEPSPVSPSKRAIRITSFILPHKDLQLQSEVEKLLLIRRMISKSLKILKILFLLWMRILKNTKMQYLNTFNSKEH